MSTVQLQQQANGVTQDNCYVCGKLSSTKCSNCIKVFYCSVEHQRRDWKRHKPNCHPFCISTNATLGRHLVASRDIKPGEIVLKEAPLISGPSQITCPVCIQCLQRLEECDIENGEQTCERCGWPICIDCTPKRSAIEHLECDITAARPSPFSIQHYFMPHPMYQCIMVLRCLLLRERDPIKYEMLMQLESHCEERCGSLQWCNDREGVAKFIPKIFNCNDRWTETEILKMSGIVQVNGHEIPLSDPPHVAIYDLASLVEHSCAPNLTKSFSVDGHILFWSPNRIRMGEHLSICYSDILWGTEARQNHLLQTKMFRCDCVRCSDVTEMGTNYSALRCTRSECSGLILPESLAKWNSDWTCNYCQQSVTEQFVKNILQRAGCDLDTMDKESENQCEKYVQHYSKWLPPTHYFICDVEFTLAQLIGSDDPSSLQEMPEEKLQMKIMLCKKLLGIFGVIAAAESRCLGTIRFELHAGLAELGRRAIHNSSDSFRSALEESIQNAEETVRLLHREPIVLSEGKICQQAKLNIDSLKLIMTSAMSSKV